MRCLLLVRGHAGMALLCLCPYSLVLPIGFFFLHGDRCLVRQILLICFFCPYLLRNGSVISPYSGIFLGLPIYFFLRTLRGLTGHCRSHSCFCFSLLRVCFFRTFGLHGLRLLFRRPGRCLLLLIIRVQRFCRLRILSRGSLVRRSLFGHVPGVLRRHILCSSRCIMDVRVKRAVPICRQSFRLMTNI